MRHILLGIFICALVGAVWGKPLDSTISPLAKPSPSTTSPASIEQKTTENPSKNTHTENITTKKPESAHPATEKDTVTTAKNGKDLTQKPNEKETKAVTVKPNEPKGTPTVAKASKEHSTQKPHKKEEPKHKKEQIENPIDDLLNEGDLSLDKLEEMILDGMGKVTLKKWNGYSIQVDSPDSIEDK